MVTIPHFPLESSTLSASTARPSARRGRSPLRVLFLLCLLSGLGLLASCGPKEEKAARGVPVVVGKAEKRTVPVALKAVGSVEAFASVAIKTQLGGQISEQFVQDGQDVAAGEPLFRIDPRPYEAAVRESQAKLERDQVQLKKANDDLRRYSGLIEKNVISRDQYEQTETTAKALAATIKLDEADLETAKLNLSYTLIASPIPGRVGLIQITLGNVIKANDDRNLATINQIRPISVSFAVPEQHLPAIMRHMSQGALRVEAYSSADDSLLAAGALASVDNSVDKSTGTIKLKATFANQDLRLWPGQFVRVVLNLSAREGAVVVPSKAVQAGTKGQYVYVVDAENKAQLTPVTTGAFLDGLTVVESGLSGTETVVTEGQIRLVPGALVEISKPKTATAEAGNQTDGAGEKQQ